MLPMPAGARRLALLLLLSIARPAAPPQMNLRRSAGS
jgi:hypothetical protein